MKCSARWRSSHRAESAAQYSATEVIMFVQALAPARLRFVLALAGALAWLAIQGTGPARAQGLPALAAQLGSDDRKVMQAAIGALGASNDPVALRVLRALEDGKLRIASSGQALIADGARLTDAISGKPAAGADGAKEPL